MGDIKIVRTEKPSQQKWILNKDGDPVIGGHHFTPARCCTVCGFDMAAGPSDPFNHDKLQCPNYGQDVYDSYLRLQVELGEDQNKRRKVEDELQEAKAAFGRGKLQYEELKRDKAAMSDAGNAEIRHWKENYKKEFDRVVVLEQELKEALAKYLPPITAGNQEFEDLKDSYDKLKNYNKELIARNQDLIDCKIKFEAEFASLKIDRRLKQDLINERCAQVEELEQLLDECTVAAGDSVGVSWRDLPGMVKGMNEELGVLRTHFHTPNLIPPDEEDK